jgi:two-component system, NtrC family, sensor histidine kinase HydH
LNQLLKTAVDGYQREFARLSIQTRFELVDDLPCIVGNPGLLAQMLNSLIANAIEAMPRGGALTMRSRFTENKRKIELQIADTGMGISSEQLQKIFQPFSTSKRKGLGLGLALVKRTIERIGGSIRINSQVGRGTQAMLVFPVANS